MNEKATHDREEKASTRPRQTVKAKGDDKQQTNGAGPKPQALQGNLRQLPPALAVLVKLPHWVLWRWELNKKGTKWTKVPYQPNGKKASSTNSKTWSTYDEVIAVLDKFDGIGFCLLNSDFAAFDIDDCRDATTGVIDPWTTDLVTKAGSYTEITVSGTGLRVIGLGTGPKVHRKQPVADGVTLETYRRAERYIVITGNPLPGTPYQVANIDAHIDAVVAELDAKKKQKKTKSTSGDKGELPQALRLMLYIQGDQPAGYPSRSELFWAFICEALRRGIDENVIVAATLDQAYAGNSIHAHVEANGGEDYVKRQIEQAANTLIDNKGRVFITFQEGKTDEIWRATQKALLAHGSPVYVRANKLVQPLWRWEKSDGGGTVLTTRFERLNVTRLTDMVAHRVVQFQKYDSKSRLRNIDPPKIVILNLLEAGYWLFPSAVGIINAPTMRKDGSLLTEQGYDQQTKLWYKSSGDVTLPAIPERPTRADAEKALQVLNGLFVDFPFEDNVARTVAVAAMMTTALRGALTVVPIFLVTATEPRSGKTYLVHLITMLATGHIPPSTAGASEDRPDEVEKRIETAALSGRPIMHLNNLPNGMVLDSARLAELCTEGIVYIRILGKHEEAPCDCRATTVFLNGNNVQVAGDLIARTLLCRLNPRSEEPEKRTFNSDPVAQVRNGRGIYLAAIFTIVRAFIQAGAPEPANMHSVAGFEDWSRLVQQPLMWLGMADPLGNRLSMRAMDPTLDELKNLLAVLRENFRSGERFTVAQCTKLAEEQTTDAHGRPCYRRPALRELMTAHGKVNPRSFGRLLGRHHQRLSEGWYYQLASTTHGSAVYVLVGPQENEQSAAQPMPKEEPL